MCLAPGPAAAQFAHTNPHSDSGPSTGVSILADRCGSVIDCARRKLLDSALNTKDTLSSPRQSGLGLHALGALNLQLIFAR